MSSIGAVTQREYNWLKHGNTEHALLVHAVIDTSKVTKGNNLGGILNTAERYEYAFSDGKIFLTKSNGTGHETVSSPNALEKRMLDVAEEHIIAVIRKYGLNGREPPSN